MQSATRNPFVNRMTLAALICLLGSCVTPGEQAKTKSPQIKNIIMLIGDGMGPQQVGLLLSYARQAPHGVLSERNTAVDRIMQRGRLGIVLPHPADSLVTDSASAATQLASGQFSRPELLGVDQHGDRVVNIVERAKQLGKATGLVSDTRITHATPAAFAAHQSHRSQENDIAEDLLATAPDVMLSAGYGYWIPKDLQADHSASMESLRQANGADKLESKRTDNKNLLSAAERQGYRLAFNREQLASAQGKVLGLFAPLEMPDGIMEKQTKDDPTRTIPTLREMTAEVLKRLETRPQGFFVMIEAGQIDWASHHNDTGLLLHEMLKFNETLNYVLDWAAQRDDTLIMVTADHETGGFGFSYSSANIPPAISLPGKAFAGKAPYRPKVNYGNPEVLDRLYAQRLSYHELFKRFNVLPKERQTPDELMTLVNAHTEFKISRSQAETILTTEANPLYREGQADKIAKLIPKMPVNSAFFPYAPDNRENLLAQAVASDQSVVWASGTHTSTPVYLFTQGPGDMTVDFAKVLHQTQVGQLAIKALE